MVLDNFKCDQSRESEFTSFSLSQPSNDTFKILSHSLEENGNPDVKTTIFEGWEDEGKDLNVFDYDCEVNDLSK
nr:hypothetical protein [Tanacetum cinerariifolium]